jgi:hypothetical protein
MASERLMQSQRIGWFIGGLVLLLGAGCRSWNPMAYDFRGAASDEHESQVADVDAALATRPFAAAYGAQAVPFLIEALQDGSCSAGGSDLRRAWAALRVLRQLHDERARPALQASIDAACTHPALRWQVRRVLAELNGESTAAIALEELRAGPTNTSAQLLLEILSSRDPSLAPRLEQMGAAQKDRGRRALFNFIGLVLSDPDRCRLNPHGSVPLADRGGYVCHYTCPRTDAYHQLVQPITCDNAIPLPPG